MQMRIKKKASLSKYPTNKSNQMSQTLNHPFTQQTNILFTNKQSEKTLPKLPPIRKNVRNFSAKVIDLQPIRKETETTLNESTMMFQSMYGQKQWLKPSDYVKQIVELNLLGEQRSLKTMEFDINLTQKFQKNIQKYSRMKQVTSRWIEVLRKALSYTKSKRASTQKLSQQIKFWKLLSKKFDELQYQFNDERTTNLLSIMTKFLKIEPAFRPLLEEFLYLKEEIIKETPQIKKLYLQLEETVSPFITTFQQCSDIYQSINLLKKILIGFKAIGQENKLIKNRYMLIYEKIDTSMTYKLFATSLYPRYLANISSVKDNYHIINQALSFYSHFINSLQAEQINDSLLIERCQYVRNVLANLMQILSYFEYLYSHKEVNQFSKLFSHSLDYNIYDRDYQSEWTAYMELVLKSMEIHDFQP